MYVLDDRFLTVVAYVDGCDAATHGVLLQNFTDWLYAARVGPGRTSLDWPGVLKVARGLDVDRRSYGDLTQQENAQLIDDLFGALDEYLASNEHVFEVAKA